MPIRKTTNALKRCATGTHRRRSLLAAKRIHRLSVISDYLGLSLTALSPAAAWYFLFDCVSFFRPAGRKNDTQGTEHDRQAKVQLFEAQSDELGG